MPAEYELAAQLVWLPAGLARLAAWEVQPAWFLRPWLVRLHEKAALHGRVVQREWALHDSVARLALAARLRLAAVPELVELESLQRLAAPWGLAWLPPPTLDARD